MLRSLLVVLVVPGVLTFQVPTTPPTKRVVGLHLSVNDPWSVKDSWLDAVIRRAPAEVCDGVRWVNFAVAVLCITKYEFPPPLDSLTVAVTTLVVALLQIAFDARKRAISSPEFLVRTKIKTPYVPEWPGPSSWVQEVQSFVGNNSGGTTLVLVDPTATVKEDLLDEMFRGQARIVAPVMDNMVLSEDLAKDLDIDDVSLDQIANLIAQNVRPLLPGVLPVNPAKIIIDLLPVQDPTTLSSVVRDVTLFKDAVQGNAVTIVTVPNGDFIKNLPLPIQNKLTVLRN